MLFTTALLKIKTNEQHNNAMMLHELISINTNKDHSLLLVAINQQIRFMLLILFSCDVNVFFFFERSQA